MDVEATLTAHLVGRHLADAKRREYDWSFGFGDAGWWQIGIPIPRLQIIATGGGELAVFRKSES